MSKARLIGLGTGALILVGIALRIRQYTAARSLWLDEAMLALNLASRSYLGLIRPLHYDQAATIPFLWGERFVIHLAGVNELSLRLLPLLAGCVLLPAIWKLAGRIFGPTAALLALAFAAFSSLLITYSNEAKPYMIDALATVLILHLALDVLDAPAETRRWRRLLVGGIVALLVSLPGLFVLAGVVVTLLCARQTRQHPGARRTILETSAVWIAVFSINYLLFDSSSANNAYLQDFWGVRFLTLGTRRLLVNAPAAAHEVVHANFVGGQPSLLVAVGIVAPLFILLLVGLRRIIYRVGGSVAIMVTGPIFVAAAAAMLNRYPLAARLMLFASPLLILLMVEGIIAVVELLPARYRLAGFALVGVVCLAPSLAVSTERALLPPRDEHVRPVIEHFLQLHRKNDAVYVDPRGLAAWVFYTTNWKAPDSVRLEWLGKRATSRGQVFWNSPGRGHRVRHEGQDLVLTHSGFREIYGIPTGMQVKWTAGLTQQQPDTGWAENEADRIAAAARPLVWVFLVRMGTSAATQLRAELHERGGRPVRMFEDEDVTLTEYRFPSRISPVAGQTPWPAAALP